MDLKLAVVVTIFQYTGNFMIVEKAIMFWWPNSAVSFSKSILKTESIVYLFRVLFVFSDHLHSFFFLEPVYYLRYSLSYLQNERKIPMAQP